VMLRATQNSRSTVISELPKLLTRVKVVAIVDEIPETSLLAFLPVWRAATKAFPIVVFDRKTEAEVPELMVLVEHSEMLMPPLTWTMARVISHHPD